MKFILAVVGAVATSLLNLTIAPLLRIGDAQPDFVLIGAVVWTVANGIEGALAWAFIGGLMIDFLSPRPLGSTAFTLLLCVGGALLLAQLTLRFRLLIPVVAVFLFSVVNALLFLVVYGALRGPILAADPLSAVLPAAVYNGIVAAIVGPLTVAVISRRESRERLDW